MAAIDLDTLRRTVQHNCDVSDARHARDASICTYLLRMRAQYRWAHGRALADPLPGDEVGAWIEAQERRWARLAGKDYRPLPLGGPVDPFDIETANRRLAATGLAYAAGVGVGGKPSFLLAELDAAEAREGLRILRLGREHARDVAGAPAMTRSGYVFLRREQIRAMVWDELGLAGRRPAATPMARAAAAAGSGDALATLAEAQEELALLHELGEAAAGRLLGPGWEAHLAALAGTPAEHVLRAVRDLLADCLRVLPVLIGDRRPLHLHLYAARLEGPRRTLFARFEAAYRRWLADPGDWRPLHEAAAAGRAHWLATARGLLAEPASALASHLRGPAALAALRLPAPQPSAPPPPTSL
ncbi:Sfum_1244 family protein [Inmirania thermothiophila]|uniref:Uncharacterized protein n=1 Tax=Inmirania thermothiophila TaxID=1750597 RepID=A0A3N1Y036_9GAMM|nr:Sfum_1244 family protein [Inmirania thermothiophila]ROR32180.1 hypothetical protein EDC57_1371 [Inmirania thermothiophila]